MGSHKGANREHLEVYSNPKQDRFQDLLEAICPEFLHTNSNQIKYLSLLFQHTSPVECRSCVVYAQNSILCQFGNSEICPNFANPYLTQFSSISGGNCISVLSPQERKNDQVWGVSGETVAPPGIGSIRLRIEDDLNDIHTIHLHDVRYLPEAPINIFVPQVFSQQRQAEGDSNASCSISADSITLQWTGENGKQANKYIPLTKATLEFVSRLQATSNLERSLLFAACQPPSFPTMRKTNLRILRLRDPSRLRHPTPLTLLTTNRRIRNPRE